jgi:hypothetical protein
LASADSFLNRFGGHEADTEAPEELLGAGSGALSSFLDKFGGPAMTSYFFYDNTVELRFDKESWTYYLVGPLGELTAQYGVTGTVKIIDKSMMLVPWAAKMVVEKLLRIIPTRTTPEGTVVVPEMPLEEFTRWALDAKGAHKEKLEDASTVGHEAHGCLEESIKHAIIADSEKIVRKLVALPFEIRAESCSSAGLKWMQAHNVRWQSTEKKIYSREHKYAGTLDGLAIVDSCNDPTCCKYYFKDCLTVIDWKTSNALRLEYILQVAAYIYAYQEEHGVKIMRCFILRLGKDDGEFESLQLDREDIFHGFEGFLACLELLKCVDTVNERWKANKLYKKEVQKKVREDAKIAEKAAKVIAKEEAKALKANHKIMLKIEAKLKRAAAKLVLSPKVELINAQTYVPEEPIVHTYEDDVTTETPCFMEEDSVQLKVNIPTE